MKNKDISKSFRKKVLEIVAQIPFGKVMSYGQVALYSGSPRAARQVGWILHSTEGKKNLPWWRVVNNEGLITIKGSMYYTKEDQKMLLEAEGVIINDKFEFNIEKYRHLL